jgi:hypothetical protein
MWSRIDFVAEFEPPHSRSDLDHDPSHVISEDERQAIRQDELELSIPDLRIQRVYTSGMYPNQDVVLAQLGVWHLAKPQALLAPITIDNKCLHDVSLSLPVTISRPTAAG